MYFPMRSQNAAASLSISKRDKLCDLSVLGQAYIPLNRSRALRKNEVFCYMVSYKPSGASDEYFHVFTPLSEQETVPKIEVFEQPQVLNK
jgi:hypothetical protein